MESINEDINIKQYIGDFEKPETLTQEFLAKKIHEIFLFPKLIHKEVKHLTEEQLDTPYRIGGWTVRQVIHHIADADVNYYTRIKLALTEEKPVIKPFLQNNWSALFDARTDTIGSSIKIIEGLHEKIHYLLKSLSETELNKTFIHPDDGQEHSIKEVIAFLAWHCYHHLAQIIILKEKEGWK